MRDAVISAIRTFGPGPENLTSREWADAVQKLQTALANSEPERCEATPVGGWSAGWRCDLR